jgi:hypothetical protein
MSGPKATNSIGQPRAPQEWEKALTRVSRGDERLLLEEEGRPVAALVSVDDLRRLETLDAQREQDFQALAVIRDAFRDVPDDELEREVEKTVAEARAQLRAEREGRAARPA